MDIDVTKVFEAEDPNTIIRCCGDLIVATRETDNLCRVQLYSAEPNQLSFLLHEWHLPGVTDAGDVVGVDSLNKAVFIAHKDSNSVTTLFADGDLSRKSVRVPIRGDISKIVPINLSNNKLTGAFMAVFSSTSEIAVLHAESSKSVVSYSTSLSFSCPLASVSVFDDNVLALACIEQNRVTLRSIRVDYEPASKSIKTFEFPVLRLPKVISKHANNPRQFVLGCIVQRSGVFVLYANGELHAFLARNHIWTPAAPCVGRIWWNDSEGDRASFEKPSSIHYLRTSGNPRSSASPSSEVHFGSGGLCAFGDSYIAAAFGKFVSVWDTTYQTDHGYAELSGPVEGIQSFAVVGSALLRTATKVFTFEIDTIGERNIISLGDAMRRKGTCAKVLAASSTSRQASLLTSQPVATRWLQTASAANENFSDVYQKHLNSHSEKEIRLAQSIMDRNRDADSICKIVNSFRKAARRGTTQQSSTNVVSQLPSVQLVAAAVARCLLEIRLQNLEFVKPFIDVVGMGSVWNEAIQSCLMKFANKFRQNAGNMTSITTLLANEQTIHGMEAAVACIQELSERDIVRAAQYAIRLHRVCEQREVKHGDGNPVESSPVTSSNEHQRMWVKNQKLKLKADRLLIRCVTTNVNRSELMHELKEITMSDVIAFLRYFSMILERFRTSSDAGIIGNKESMSDSCDIEDYRGFGGWLDDAANRPRESEEMTGCLFWISAILDVHQASLVLDDDCYEVLQRLLKLTTMRRSESESVISVMGALTHARSELPVPSYRNLYECRTIQASAPIGRTSTDN